MIALWAAVAALCTHWVADFVCQPHWMSMRKSKEWSVLAAHALVISAAMMVFGVAVMSLRHPFWVLLLFMLGNGGTHFLIDAVTSRVTSRLYAAERVHDFFVVIGFDQLLHTAILLALLWAIR